MTTIVVDIETAPLADADLPPSYVEKLKRKADPPESWRDRLGLDPIGGQVVCAAMLNPGSHKGLVAYWPGDGADDEITIGDATFATCPLDTEKAVLDLVWSMMRKFVWVATFNGRSFDEIRADGAHTRSRHGHVQGVLASDGERSVYRHKDAGNADGTH